MNCEWVSKTHKFVDSVWMGIDQVSLSIPFPPLELPQGELSQDEFLAFVKSQHQQKMKALETINYVRWVTTKLFKTAPPKLVKNSTTLQRISVFCEADNSNMATLMLGLHFGKPLLNFSFNPSKLTSEGRNELDVLLTMTHPLGYEGIYSEGRIARLEFYLDIEDENATDLILLDTGKRMTTLFRGTTYNGRRGTSLVGTAYNKAAQLKIDQPLTRIEARIKRADKSLIDVVEGNLANPFASFLVVPASGLTQVAKEWSSETLASQIHQHGLHGGIKNTHARKAITKRLRELALPWWNPEKIWQEFIGITQGFRPSFIGGVSD